jgi:hypothetical protein
MLGGLQNWCELLGAEENLFPWRGIEPWTVHPAAQSLYRLNCPPAAVNLQVLKLFFFILEAFLPLQCSRPSKETFLSRFIVVIHPEPGSSLMLSFLLRICLPSCVFPQGLTATTVCCHCRHACCLEHNS